MAGSTSYSQLCKTGLAVLRTHPQVMLKAQIIAILGYEAGMSLPEAYYVFYELLADDCIRTLPRSPFFYYVPGYTKPESFEHIVCRCIDKQDKELLQKILHLDGTEEDNSDKIRQLLKIYIDLEDSLNTSVSFSPADYGSSFTGLFSLPNWYPDPACFKDSNALMYRAVLSCNANSDFLQQQQRYLTIGYPTAVKNGQILPVFTQRVRCKLAVATGVQAETSVLDLQPQLNDEWLSAEFSQGRSKQSGTASREGLLEALRLSGCGYADLYDDLQEHDRPLSGFATSGGWTKLCAVLQSRPGLEVRDVLTPFSLRQFAPDLPDGIYNIALICQQSESSYTKSLVHDLRDLIEVPDDRLEATALPALFSCNEQTRPVRYNSDLVFSSSDLSAETAEQGSISYNKEQKEAIASMLDNKITVLQGPPGTGKTQVIAGAILNAQALGQTVLVASTNHQAVSAAIERCAKEPWLKDILVRANDRSGMTDNSLLKVCREGLKINDDYFPAQECFRQAQEKRQQLLALSEIIDDCRQIQQTLDDKELALELMLQEMTEHPLSPDFARTVQKVSQKCSQHKDLQALLQSFDQFLYLKRLPPVAFMLVNILAWYKSRRNIRKAWRKIRRFCTSGSLHEVRPFRDLIALQVEVQQLRQNFAAAAEQARQRFKKGSLFHVQPETGKEAAVLQELQHKFEQEEVPVLHDLCRQAEEQFRRADLQYLSSKEDEVITDGKLYQYSGYVSASKRDAFNKTLLDSERALQKTTRAVQTVLRHRPVWFCSVLSARKYFPLLPGIFDLVIFDESAQFDFISALPLIYRAKRVAFTGDPNQLEPIVKISSDRQDLSFLQAGLDPYDGNSRWKLIERSSVQGQTIKSLWKFAFKSPKASCLQLFEARRSCRAITEYISRESYDGLLMVRTDESKLQLLPQGYTFGIRWEHVSNSFVNRLFGSRSCEAEARKVVEILHDLYVSKKFKGSVGVITPYNKQEKLLRDLISADGELTDLINERAEDIPVATVHKFQGAECDVIIMSLCLESSGCNAFIQQAPNLINVAVSRARCLVICVGDKHAALNSTAKFLVHLAEQGGATADPDAPLRPSDSAEVRHKFESPLEKLLYDKLVDKGLKPPCLQVQYEVNVGHGRKRRLDMALIDTEKRKYLDIEVDGSCHFDELGRRNKDDFRRDRQLRALNFEVIRFTGRQVYRFPKDCANEIHDLWNTMLNEK